MAMLDQDLGLQLPLPADDVRPQPRERGWLDWLLGTPGGPKIGPGPLPYDPDRISTVRRQSRLGPHQVAVAGRDAPARPAEGLTVAPATPAVAPAIPPDPFLEDLRNGLPRAASFLGLEPRQSDPAMAVRSLLGYDQGVPEPAKPATPDFGATPAAPAPSVASGPPDLRIPPAQGFDTPMQGQGFEEGAPASLSPAATPPPGPAWPGLLHADVAGPVAGGMSAPAPAAAPPRRDGLSWAESAAVPNPGGPAASKAADVPETSLLGRIGGGIGDALKGFDKWRQDNRLTLMALGAGMAGAQNLGQGLNRGMQMAVPAMQADIKQAQQNQTVAALIKRGIPQDVALAAAGNPAVMQQIIGQVFGPKAYQHVTVKDRLGNEIPLVFDPASGKYINPPAGIGGGSLSAGDPTKTGEDYLKTLDPMTANEVRAFAEGRAPVTARNLQTMLPMVTQYDPAFSADVYKAREALRKGYLGGGKQFQETLALNTVSDHLGHLADAADRLDNSTWKPINRVKNWWSDNFTGNPALVNFRGTLVTTQNELAKAYHGGHVSDSAYNAFSKAINEAQTPEELKATIGNLAGLLQSKIQANEEGYKSGMAQGAQLPDDYRAVSDKAKHSFSRINDWAMGIKGGTEAPAAPAVTSGTPKPGTSWDWTPAGLVPAAPAKTSAAEPPIKGARLGFHQDGSRGWFIDDPNRPGKFLHVNIA